MNHFLTSTPNYLPHHTLKGTKQNKNTDGVILLMHCSIKVRIFCQCPCHPLFSPHHKARHPRLDLALIWFTDFFCLEIECSINHLWKYQTLSSNITEEQYHCPARNYPDFQTSRRQLQGVTKI